MVAIVEMFGMPGSGKTTLTHAVSEFVPGNTNSDLSRAWANQAPGRRLLYIARGLLDLPAVAAAAELALRARILNGEGLFRLLRLVAKTHWIRSQEAPLFLDQGFLQDLWSILYCAGRMDPDPALLVRLIRRLYRGADAGIIHLALDAQTAAVRIRGRTNGASRFDGKQEVVVRQSLSSAARLDGALIRAAVDAGLDVQSLDGAEPVAALADRMRRALAGRGL